MTDVKTITEAAVTPATFDFAAAVLDRSYPVIEVPVYLNEKAVLEYLNVARDRTILENRIAATSKPTVEMADQLEKIDYKYHELRKEIKDQEFLVRVQGVSPAKQIEMDKLAYEKFPIQYDEGKNPITGAVVRSEIESDERDEFFATLIRQSHILSVVAPDGAVDFDFSDFEKVRTTWAVLPIAAREKIDLAIRDSALAVDYYRELVDEVF